MKCALLTAAAISLLLSHADTTFAQAANRDRAEVRVQALAASTLARSWLDWRHDGPENAGICLVGSVERDSTGAQVSTIHSAIRVARLSGCSNPRTIGAAIFTPTELFDLTQLEALACAAVRGHDEWVVFGIVTGTETKLLGTGKRITVAEGLWCTEASDDRALLAARP